MCQELLLAEKTSSGPPCSLKLVPWPDSYLHWKISYGSLGPAGAPQDPLALVLLRWEGDPSTEIHPEEEASLKLPVEVPDICLSLALHLHPPSPKCPPQHKSSLLLNLAIPSIYTKMQDRESWQCNRMVFSKLSPQVTLLDGRLWLTLSLLCITECDIKTCIINKTGCDLGFQPVIAISEDGCCPIFSCSKYLVSLRCFIYSLNK